ncbi:MAG: hypothetical protein K0S64_611 [Gaiellaceae bacterium]|jgi:hypothetical protein|nr:hypothetical protein [Gaiellaceae bacterium]
MSPATLELLSWIAEEPRTYPDAIDVWRTNCPQHSVWEDAIDGQLIEVVRDGSRASVVVTERGRAALEVSGLDAA